MTYMRKIVVKVFAVLLVCALCAHAEDTLLYFQIVDKPTIITFDNQTVAWDEYVWNKNGTDYSVNAARVVSMNGNVDTPLALHYNAGGTLTDTGVSMVNMGVNMPLYAALPLPAFLWLLAGGIVYTVGGVIYALIIAILIIFVL